MKIYVVAHENIVCPKEYRKVEIMEQQVTIQISYVELKAYVKRGLNPLLL